MGLLKKERNQASATGSGGGGGWTFGATPRRRWTSCPCVGALSQRQRRPGWLTVIAEREKQGLSLEEACDRPGDRGRNQPVPRGHGPGLPAPVREVLQPHAQGRLGRDQLRGALHRRLGHRAEAGAAGDRRRGALRREGRGGRLRPLRAVVRLPAGPARLQGHGLRRLREARRHAALRDPAVSAAARGPRRGGPADPRRRRRAARRGHGRTDITLDELRRVERSSSASGRTRAGSSVAPARKRRTSGPGPSS